MSEPKYHGLKVVALDRKAIVRRVAKRFCKEMSKPGVRAISFIVEREDGTHIQSSHADDSTLSEIFLKAAHTVRGF